MTLAAAIAAVGNWAVTGVVGNYALDETPALLPVSALPALLLVPAVQVPDAGARAFDLELTAGLWRVDLEHVLLLGGAALGKPAGSFAGAVTLIDNYAAAVRSDWYAGDNLIEPIKITSINLRPYPLGAGVYWAIVFRHVWTLSL
jgi:hypothetical protein